MGTEEIMNYRFLENIDKQSQDEPKEVAQQCPVHHEPMTQDRLQEYRGEWYCELGDETYKVNSQGELILMEDE